MPSIFLRRNKKPGSDEELLARYREEGDIRILGQLYERYMQLVFGVCLKYLGEREQAKDEVMNIFEKLVTAVPQQEISNFRTWLYVVTKNHCLMLLRSRKSETAHAEAMMNDPVFFMENSSGMHPVIDDGGPDLAESRIRGFAPRESGEPDNEGSYREADMERLEECIERLKEEQRSCIRLFFYEGCSYQQISDKLGLEENKVKSYIQNGKRNLKICIEGLKFGRSEV